MHTLSLVLLSIGGIGDWGMILLAVILLFGGKKIPELMRGLGQGINEFNRAKNNLNTEIQEGVNSAQNMNRQQPAQNQFNSTPSSTTSNTAAPANTGATDQLQKQIEQLQQTLNQLKQQQ
jgi:sec-independent protein translocase protein TatA